MREYIEANLIVIRKYLKKRKKYTSKLNNASIMEEFKEWSKDPLPETESIWTLPDLTRKERLKNYLISFLIERQKFFSLSFLVKSGKVQIDSVSGNRSSLHSLNSSIIETLFNFDVYFFRFFKYFLITVRFSSIYSLIINN